MCGLAVVETGVIGAQPLEMELPQQSDGTAPLSMRQKAEKAAEVSAPRVVPVAPVEVAEPQLQMVKQVVQVHPIARIQILLHTHSQHPEVVHQPEQHLPIQ
jgi:hypothetical protein